MALEAHLLVHGDRGKMYAHPLTDYERTCALFMAVSGHDLSPAEGVLFMVSVKLSRIANALDEDMPYELWRDSVVDVAGYMECLDGIMTAEPDDDEDEGGEEDPAPDLEPSGDTSV